MTILRALFLVPELAPLTGTSPQAKEHNFLSRAIAQLGVDVVVAVPGTRVADTARSGLARRLTPLVVTGDDGVEREVTVSQGSAAGGRVSLVVIDVPAGIPDDQARSVFFQAAHVVAGEQEEKVDVVFASHGTESALARLSASTDDAEAGTPIRIFLLRDPTDPELDVALSHADRAVVSSASWVDQIVANIDSGRRDQLTRRLESARDILRGVPSGIDTVEWNPHQDGLLVRDFTRDPAAGKAAHKQGLRDRLHLRASDPRVPVLAIIGPIDDNVLTYGIANQLAQMPLQMVLVTDPEVDVASLRYFRRLANQGPDHLAIRTFDDPARRREFVHHLVAGADFFLIPRDASPAGVSDLYPMAYGCVPIAPRVGSYADTLVEFDTLSGTGSGFLYRPYETDHLLDAIQRALEAYRREDTFGPLLQRLMDMDLSWRATAQRYVNIIVDLIQARRAAVELAG